MQPTLTAIAIFEWASNNNNNNNNNNLFSLYGLQFCNIFCTAFAMPQLSVYSPESEFQQTI